MLNATNLRNRSPFTAAQWQELEHQALIYKHMVSGVSIPPELLYSVKRSLESSLASRLYPQQPIGWGCFQVGFGRKVDPEPGRCRRTDGKKWRCSKEAYPDSKYCERHMHRGRNRSRKPVEPTTATGSTININNPSPSISINTNFNTITSSSNSTSSYTFSPLSESEIRPFLYPYSSTSRPPGSSFSPQGSTTHNLFLDSASSHLDKDYRYFHGLREGSDERAFFPEVSGSLQGSYNQLAMSPYKDHQQQHEQHCFVLGADFKSPTTKPIKLEKETETQKPLHHFFGEWQSKNTDSWLDLASTSRLQPDG